MTSTTDVRDELNEEAYWGMIDCALRFDGYRWAEESGKGTDYLWQLLERFSKSLTLSDDHEENLATFFILQRDIRNDEASHLSPPDTYIAFRLLYLALYEKPVPRRYVYPESDRAWRRRKGRREALAAVARREIVALSAARAEILENM